MSQSLYYDVFLHYLIAPSTAGLSAGDTPRYHTLALIITQIIILRSPSLLLFLPFFNFLPSLLTSYPPPLLLCVYAAQLSNPLLPTLLSFFLTLTLTRTAALCPSTLGISSVGLTSIPRPAFFPLPTRASQLGQRCSAPLRLH